MEVSGGGDCVWVAQDSRGAHGAVGTSGEEEAARGTHLMFDIVQGVGRVNGEANEDNVGFGICQGAQPFVVLLSCCIPERQLY